MYVHRGIRRLSPIGLPTIGQGGLATFLALRANSCHQTVLLAVVKQSTYVCTDVRSSQK